MATSSIRVSMRNVVVIGSDDMRLDALDGATALSALAARSLRLGRHYAPQASCSPARTAMLTSRRPDSTRVYDLYSYWRDVGGDYISLPQLCAPPTQRHIHRAQPTLAKKCDSCFAKPPSQCRLAWFTVRANGFEVLGFGKVFHPWHASGHREAGDPHGAPRVDDQDAQAARWSAHFWRATTHTPLAAWDARFLEPLTGSPRWHRHVPEAALRFEKGLNRSWASVPDSTSLPDELIADAAIAAVRRLERPTPPERRATAARGASARAAAAVPGASASAASAADAEMPRNFILMAGFLRPHLPFVAPRRFFDRHPLSSAPLSR